MFQQLFVSPPISEAASPPKSLQVVTPTISRSSLQEPTVPKGREIWGIPGEINWLKLYAFVKENLWSVRGYKPLEGATHAFGWGACLGDPCHAR